MSNTSFCFRRKFLLSAHTSQIHATSCLSLISHHQVNNKCNRVKGQHWRWLTSAYVIFYYIICFVFSEATTNVLESITNSTGKHLRWSLFLSLKWWNYIKTFVLHEELYFCQILFLIDWCHKCLKNTIDLLLFYKEHFHGFPESDLWKCQKNIHFTTNISIYTGDRHFKVLWSFILYIHFTTNISIYTGHWHFDVSWSFILYILSRFVLSLKSSHYGYIPPYKHKTLPTLGNEEEQQQIKFYEKSSDKLIFSQVTKYLKMFYFTHPNGQVFKK